MPELTVAFEVWCSCGNGLCRQTIVEQRQGINVIVEPCERCLQKAENEGYDKGYEKGQAETEAQWQWLSLPAPG